MENKRLIDQAMIEINNTLERYNLAGFVVIHTPGQVKVLAKLDPTYSCVKMEQGGKISFKADRMKDFGGNRAAMEERVLQTAEMLTAIVTTAATNIIPIGQLQKKVNSLMEHGDNQADNVIKVDFK